MKKRLIVATVISTALICLLKEPSNADVKLSEVTSPKSCGSFLKVTSKQTKQGLIEFVIRINPEQAAHVGELYRDRVGTVGRLKISSADSTLATMRVEESSNRLLHKQAKKDLAEFRFELAPQLATHSIFTITTSLYEKNGIATSGGGIIYRIHLDGFLPADSDKSLPAG